ncbi:MAG: metallophosphoesterase family protein [Chloroflexota bacterium]|nr:MAG: metallophosphoesterase family protein [Chloroflexota bacterium]
MKIAVLADIHGNMPALERVTTHIEAWGPDHVIMAGDVVNRGPEPRTCLQFIEEKQRSAGWQLVRGNHEDYVLVHARPDAPRSGPEFEIYLNSYWTYRRLEGKIESLKAMPFQVTVTGPDGREVRVVHASMRGNRIGIYSEMPDAMLDQLITPAPAVLCVGHTHRPLVRQLGDTLVVNAGAVGMPFDGDRRAAYAQLTWKNDQWAGEIIRLDYDQKQTEEQFHASGFIPEAGPLAEIMLLEFRQARSHIHLWLTNYQPLVLSGEMTMAESVQSYFNSIGR